MALTLTGSPVVLSHVATVVAVAYLGIAAAVCAPEVNEGLVTEGRRKIEFPFPIWEKRRFDAKTPPKIPSF